MNLVNAPSWWEEDLFDSEFYTTAPRAGHAAKQHSHYKSRLIDSLSHLLSVAGVGCKVDTSAGIERLQSVAGQSHLPARLYNFHFRLLRDLKAQDTAAVAQLLKEYEDLDLTCIGPGIANLQSLYTEAWEYAEAEGCVENAPPEREVTINDMRAVEPAILVKHLPQVLEAFRLIKAADPIVAAEIQEYVSGIRLFEGRVIQGVTDVRMFGVIFLRVPEPWDDPIAYFCEHIVHEAGHLHLNTLLAVDKLLLNPPDAVYQSPLRADPRPMLGVFHADFVLVRMIHVFERLVDRVGKHEWAPRLAQFRKTFSKGAASLEVDGEFTPNGLLIANSVAEVASHVH